MSAEKVGATPTIYELKAKDGLAPFRVVMEQDYWRLLGRFQLLLALAKRYASECARCSGTGMIECVPFDNGISSTVTCNDCADLRAVIAKAEGGV